MNRANLVNRIIHTLVKEKPRKKSLHMNKEMRPAYERNFGTLVGSRIWVQEAKEEIQNAVARWSASKCLHCSADYNSLRVSPNGMCVTFRAFCSRKCAAASLGKEHWAKRSASTRNTLMKKHGVVNVSQLASVKRKKEQSALAKYGVTNVLLDKGVQRKRKKTMKRNHGVTVPTNSAKIREKIRRTCMARYGGPTSFSDPEVKARAEATVAAGMRDPIKWAKRREKTVATNLQKYGVPNPQQNPKVVSKTKSSSYSTRKEIKHNGRVHLVQGAEPEFIEFLKAERGLPMRKIQLANLPTIRHSGHRVHYPDLGVKTERGLVLFDVKSAFTLGVKAEGPATHKWKSMKAKISGAAEEGYVEQAVFKCGGAWIVVDEQTTWAQVRRFARPEVRYRIRESGVSRLLASGPLP